jgi:hypothetical protein
MAKISARGDREKARWRHPESGAELVLTVKGRLLFKFQKGASLSLRRSQVTDQGAADYAAERGMERV